MLEGMWKSIRSSASRTIPLIQTMKVLRTWIERDLSAAARAGKLSPAFEVDEAVHVASELLDTGRSLIVTGEPGVGKTTVIHELIRRAQAGRGPQRLAGRRVVEISLRRRVSSLARPYDIHSEVHKLAEALRGLRRPPVLFIRDIDIAHQLSLADRLPYLGDGPILAEGSEHAVSAMLEEDAALRQQFAPLAIEEPSLERAERILRAWAEHADRHSRRFGADAIEHALVLTHRFQSRSRLPHKAIELLDQSAAEAPRGGTVTRAHVIQRFCALHRVPRVLVDADHALDLVRVESLFALNVFGQPEAVRSIVDMIGVLKAGLSDLRRPLGTLLLVGPTGVGKTYVAQLVAEVLFGRRDRLVRVNMADYPGSGDAAHLFGSPDATRKAAERGVLTNRLAGHPFAVLLLDEFEKAHTEVHDRFLQLIDEGAFINGAGETVSCRSLIVIATSNAGYDHLGLKHFGFAAGSGDSARVNLEARFRFELLNRFDRVVHFAPLSQDDVRNVALAEIGRLPGRIGLRQRRLRVEVERRVIDWIVDRGYDPAAGARNIRRAIEQHVTAALARVLSQSPPAEGSRLRLVLRDGVIVGRVIPPAAEGWKGDAPCGEPPALHKPRSRSPVLHPPYSWRRWTRTPT